MKLHAGSISPTAAEWLQRSDCPRVLGTSRSVCNLVDAKGRVLSVVASAVGRGPFAVVLTQEAPRFDQLSQDRTVRVEHDRLLIGPMSIDFGAAETFDPTPDWRTLRRKQAVLFLRLPEMQGIAATRLAVIDSPTGPSRELPGIWDNLFPCLVDRDLRGIRRFVGQLAGRGGGLTPAGDDLLVGAVYAAWSTTCDQELVRALCETAIPRTTYLSAEWLRAAATGHAAAIWHDLVSALLSDSTEATETVTRRMARTGHDSGAWMLFGFVNGVRANQARRNSHAAETNPSARAAHSSS